MDSTVFCFLTRCLKSQYQSDLNTYFILFHIKITAVQIFRNGKIIHFVLGIVICKRQLIIKNSQYKLTMIQQKIKQRRTKNKNLKIDSVILLIE